MRFGVLGPLAVWTDDGVPVTVPEVKVRLLLADLLSQDGRPVPVDRLADDLWGDTPPADPAAVLRTKVSQLRRALARAEPGARDLVEWRPAGYVLHAAGRTDADRFAGLVDQARTTARAQARSELLAGALALWRGPAFADFADHPFLSPTIARLEEQRLTATEEFVEVELTLGRHDLGELTELVDRHPLRERFRAVLMRALYRAGRQSEALDTYRDLRERLADELGLDPSPQLVALHQAILAHAPDLAAPRRGAGLPAPLTDLVGRDAEVTRVGALLENGRLVTLTGPGGVGKTRVAVAAAARLAGTFDGTVAMVELSALDHPAHATAPATPDTVAELAALALGLGDGPDPVADRVVAALRERRALLVLDNCEHVIGPAAELTTRLLTSAPGLRVLATSREPFGIPGEQVQVVPPLAVPAPGDDPARIARSAAVALFVARAAAATGGFTLDDGNADAVAVICRELDGIPLALELAAARVRSLGVSELARRLDSRFRLLSTGLRGGPARQQTLRAVIDWSWELLTGPERVVLRRLAVFSAGCTVAAAEAVCADPAWPAEHVADLLARLVDRSLATVADGRYTLTASVAAYCLDRLVTAGELAEVRRRHNEYYAGLAERAARELRGPGQREWLRALDVETANLRGAVGDAVRRGDGPLAQRLTGALAWYWFLRGRLAEARQSLTAALSLDAGDPELTALVSAWQAAFAVSSGERVDPVAALRRYDTVDDPRGQAMAQWILGSCLFGVGDQVHGERLVTDALAAFRAHGDRWGVAAALNTLAWHALARGDHRGARRNAEQSQATFDDLGDRWGQLVATENLASLAEVTGDYERAATLFRRGLRIAEQLGLHAEIPFQLCGLAAVHLATGEYAQAEELYERARGLAEEQSLRLSAAYALLGLGALARRTGRPEVAAERLRQVLDWHHRHGDEPELAARARTELGLASPPDTATGLHREAYRIAVDSGHPTTIAVAAEGLAATLTRTGGHAEAARLLGTAAAARTSAGTPLPPADVHDVALTTAAARAALGQDEFATEYRAGEGEFTPAGVR